MEFQKIYDKPHLFLALMALVTAPVSLPAQQKDQGVFECVMYMPTLPFDGATVKLQEAAAKTGWTVLAIVDAGVPAGCPYRARVLALYNPSFGPGASWRRIPPQVPAPQWTASASSKMRREYTSVR